MATGARCFVLPETQVQSGTLWVQSDSEQTDAMYLYIPAHAKPICHLKYPLN